MSKAKKSKLDPFIERLDVWFGIENKSLAEVQAQLKLDGCVVSVQRLSEWWERRQSELAESKLLAQITSGAALHSKVKTQFAKDAPPELQTLIDLHRVLIMQLSTHAASNPKMLELADRSMRTVMDYFSGQTRFAIEKQKLEQGDRRIKVLETKMQRAQEIIEGAKHEGGLTAETLEKIERELKLL